MTAWATGESTLGKGRNSEQSSRTRVAALCGFLWGYDDFADEPFGDESSGGALEGKCRFLRVAVL